MPKRSRGSPPEKFDLANIRFTEVTLATPFGEPSGPYLLGTLRGKRVAFLARHGAGHRLGLLALRVRHLQLTAPRPGPTLGERSTV